MTKPFRISLIILIITTSGCASLDSSPKKENLAKFSSAFIVPLEYAPFGIDPTFKYVTPVIPVPVLPATQIASGLSVVSVLMQLPDALKRSEAIARALEQDMSAKSPWQPTLKLANDAADILKSKGMPVIVAAKPLKLSSYSNQAINAWYNNDRATTDFTGLSSAHSPYALEILQGSSVSNGSLMLELRMKLIDPTTGEVIGRRRDYELADLPAAELVFKDNGQIYKDVFLATGHKLMQKSLDYLGLIMKE
ncbi:MAG: hypothetical protein HOO93_13755 [Methyloglobulus sp.]|nr:hypothetical protein [Methyloglobulus sp.]